MGTDCMIETVMVLNLLESLRSRDGLSKNKSVNIVSSITAQRNDQSTIILANE